MLLTVVVLSYNRPRQLQRILENLIGFKSADFSLIVKDDASPLQAEIIAIVNKYKPLLSFPLSVHSNELNLGYDGNLLDAFDVVESEYLMLLSDDDYLDSAYLGKLILDLKLREHKVYFTPYLYNSVLHRKANLGYSLKKFSDVIYNSILFSGIVFHIDSVKGLSLDRAFLSSCIYTQVYLAGRLVFQEKKFGVLPAGALRLGGDGDNFFGLNQSATNTELLANRNKITSNIIYQRFLLRVVHALALDTDPLVAASFAREYRKRVLAYVIRARANGIEAYLQFIGEFLKGAPVRSIGFFLTFFMLLVLVLPRFLARRVYEIGVRKVRYSG